VESDLESDLIEVDRRIDALLDLLDKREKEIVLKDMKIAELEDTAHTMHQKANDTQVVMEKMELEMDSLREALEVKTLQLENCMK